MEEAAVTHGIDVNLTCDYVTWILIWLKNRTIELNYSCLAVFFVCSCSLYYKHVFLISTLPLLTFF
jgi:hypothetical protein